MRTRITIAGLIIGLCLLVAIGLRRLESTVDIAVVHKPRGVMGTSCTLVAIVPPSKQRAADAALRDAENVIRNLEGQMSSWIDVSEISQLNAAPAAHEVALSMATRTVLEEARRAHSETNGAFDITCRPLIELWRQAGEQGEIPTDDEIAAAREASNWSEITLTDSGAAKKRLSTQVDLGGIAKGYTIDAAVLSLQRAGIKSGYVDIGGDQRLFGRASQRDNWSVFVKDPFGDRTLLELEVDECAACTSGNYARNVEIAGKQYNHIIDPRTGWPAEVITSVTVLAPTALTADVWATALSVDGPMGFDALPDRVVAIIVQGTAKEFRIIASPGLQRLLKKPLPDMVSIWGDEHDR